MKAWLVRSVFVASLFLVTGVCAQESDEATGLSEDEAPECVPAEEAGQSPGQESGPSGEGTGEASEAALPVCEEEEQAEPLPDETSSEDESDEEAGADEDIDPEEDFEVSPEDEISEDYPVPLPSDI